MPFWPPKTPVMPLTRCAEVPRRARRVLDQVEGDQEAAEDADQPKRVAELLAPVPDPPPGDRVLVEQASVGSVDAWPRNQPVGDHVDQPAERDHADERPEQRRDEAPSVRVVEHREDHRAGQHRHERRRARQLPPLERERLVVLGASADAGLRVRHFDKAYRGAARRPPQSAIDLHNVCSPNSGST